MLERKAIDKLKDWKRQKTTQALMVMGARQVGKTTLIRSFARAEYEALAEVNFYENPRAIEILSEAQNSDDLLLRLSVLTGVEVVPGRTLVFFDEVQECQDMLTWVKFLVEKRDLDIILSGSLLGLDAFMHVRSLPVGFLQKVVLYPLDFQEFCMATGLPKNVWEAARKSIEQLVPVSDYLHEELMTRFRHYLLVGGMPDAVKAYVESSQLVPVRAVQKGICELYESDIVKYVSDKTEARQIKMVYESVPGQLNNPSKRFKYARLGKNLRFANMETAFDWLSNAGITLEATRVGELGFPLGLSEDRSSFKLFMNDVGLLTSRLMGEASLDVIAGIDDINYGSIYENVIAQELFAKGFRLHYYSSKANGEVDFVIEDSAHGRTRLIEVKSGKDYKRHSALSNILERGLAEGATVFCNDNVQKDGGKLYLPAYAVSMMGRN